MAGTVASIAIGSFFNVMTDGTGLKRQWDIVFYSVARLVTAIKIMFLGWTEAKYRKDIDCRRDAEMEKKKKCDMDKLRD